MRLNRAHFPWPVWVRSGYLEETDEFLRLSILRGRRFFSNSPGNIHDQSEKLRVGCRGLFGKWHEKVERIRKKRGRVVRGGNTSDGLEEAQLHGNRLAAT